MKGEKSGNDRLRKEIGPKIKEARKAAGLTQEELCGEQITRNMLSQIERGAAMPSLPTLIHLAERLHMDPGYFLTEGSSPKQTQLRSSLPEIRAAFQNRQYRRCIDLCDPFTESGDDEIYLILEKCYLFLGIRQFEQGNSKSAAKLFKTAVLYGERCCYDDGDCERAQFYLQFMEAQSEGRRLPGATTKIPSQKPFFDLAIYIFIINLIADGMTERAAALYDTTRIESTLLRRHINARLSIATANYSRAKELLREILTFDSSSEENGPPLKETILRDLELCYKATGDFEGAYECATKRIALLRESGE